MRIVVTGAAGFLGWHLRSRMHVLTDHEVLPVDIGEWPRLAERVVSADAVVHLAGINRGTAREVEAGNARLAAELARALRVSSRPVRVVYANSVRSGEETPYGRGKEVAAEILAAACWDTGAPFVDVRLPNLFGEYGRPDYNTFVATFVDRIVRGAPVDVQDRPIELLHAQDAAAVLMAALGDDGGRWAPSGTRTTVRGVWDQLDGYHQLYGRDGEIPPLWNSFDVDLFNTYRAALFPDYTPIPLFPRADHRGALAEVVRTHGGPCQVFASSTRPGITRGEHAHLRKVERFVVLQGEAVISMRRLLTDRVVSIAVRGDEPVAVDIPTLWVHNLVNVGEQDLVTLFWAHGHFDPANADTWPEHVEPEVRAA